MAGSADVGEVGEIRELRVSLDQFIEGADVLDLATVKKENPVAFLDGTLNIKMRCHLRIARVLRRFSSLE